MFKPKSNSTHRSVQHLCEHFRAFLLFGLNISAGVILSDLDFSRSCIWVRTSDTDRQTDALLIESSNPLWGCEPRKTDGVDHKHSYSTTKQSNYPPPFPNNIIQHLNQLNHLNHHLNHLKSVIYHLLPYSPPFGWPHFWMAPNWIAPVENWKVSSLLLNYLKELRT